MLADFYVLLQVFFIFILPILLINFKIIHVKYRLHILFSMPFIVFLIILLEEWSLYDLGFRFDNFYQGFIPYLLLTILGMKSNKKKCESFFSKL
jgi:hypothetical protein